MHSKSEPENLTRFSTPSSFWARWWRKPPTVSSNNLFSFFLESRLQLILACLCFGQQLPRCPLLTLFLRAWNNQTLHSGVDGNWLWWVYGSITILLFLSGFIFCYFTSYFSITLKLLKLLHEVLDAWVKLLKSQTCHNMLSELLQNFCVSCVIYTR